MQNTKINRQGLEKKNLFFIAKATDSRYLAERVNIALCLHAGTDKKPDCIKTEVLRVAFLFSLLRH